MLHTYSANIYSCRLTYLVLPHIPIQILKHAFVSPHPTVVISSYTLVTNMIDSFAGEGMTWDYAILDEGHIVKNSSTKLSKAMALLRSNHRLLLTGTPVQNSLTEVGLSCTILSYHIHLYLIHGISFGRSLTGSPRAPYSAPSLTSPVGS